MLRAFVIVATLLASFICAAHEETPLQVGANGQLSDIPSTLGPVILNIQGIGTPDLSVELRAGGRVNAILPCASSLIRSRSMSDVIVEGSWYHEEWLLPYYVVVRFQDPVLNSPLASRERTGYSFLFNLRNADLMEVNRLESGPDGQVSAHFPIGCSVATGGIRPFEAPRQPRVKNWGYPVLVGVGILVLALVLFLYRRKAFGGAKDAA
jgi:hypothetical protein